MESQQKCCITPITTHNVWSSVILLPRVKKNWARNRFITRIIRFFPGRVRRAANLQYTAKVISKHRRDKSVVESVNHLKISSCLVNIRLTADGLFSTRKTSRQKLMVLNVRTTYSPGRILIHMQRDFVTATVGYHERVTETGQWIG
uniref:Uncharacterized protein LOC111114157 n=1 Tax=Crassostrea virginica TaxID=6565 RepID=A0A8B8BZ95_CRAVI|nr:uncharacterized protein LOC111114157 [Crassostrea virginica]